MQTDNLTASKLDAALSLAARGMRVFPVEPGAKDPPLVAFTKEATNDTATIERWWRQWPNANIAVSTDNLLVLDVDPAKGGAESLKFLAAVNDDLPPSMVTSTGRGGAHLYYAVDLPVACSVSRLGKGLDVRGYHGYVVAPGSAIPEGSYTFANDAPIARAPQWLVDLAGAPAERKPVAQAIEELDSDHATKRAVEWLRTAAPLAIQGDAGDATTYQVAARLMDFGLSPDGAYEAMQENWNERCSPPWSPEELERKIGNAAKYRQEPIGSRDPRADFDVVDVAEGAPPPEGARAAKRFNFLAVDDLKPTRADWLVEGWFERRSTALVFGPPNAGKSWLALYLAACVARGSSFFGQATQQGKVLYVAAEDPHGIQRRFTAERLNGGNLGTCSLLCDPVNLKEPAAVRELLAAIEIEATLLGDLALIVVDTLAMAAAGMDENAGSDMNAVLQSCKALAEHTGACVVLLHHQGKDVTKGARGHSSLSAFANSILHVTKAQSGQMQIEHLKQKSGPLGAKAFFSLRPVEIAIEGDRAESQAVVVPLDRTGIQAVADFSVDLRPPTPREHRALEVLRALAAKNSGGVRFEEWQDALAAEGIGGKGARQAAYEIRDSLVGKGRISVADKLITVATTATGDSAAT